LPARSSPGIFENSFNVPVPRPEFSKKIQLPQPGILKNVRGTCSQTGDFREYSLSQPRSISKFLAFPSKKSCRYWDSSTNLLVTRQMSYHYTASSPYNEIIFLFICHEENYDL
jgi:hypothetical protein